MRIQVPLHRTANQTMKLKDSGEKLRKSSKVFLECCQCRRIQKVEQIPVNQAAVLVEDHIVRYYKTVSTGPGRNIAIIHIPQAEPTFSKEEDLVQTIPIPGSVDNDHQRSRTVNQKYYIRNGSSASQEKSSPSGQTSTTDQMVSTVTVVKADIELRRPMTNESVLSKKSLPPLVNSPLVSRKNSAAQRSEQLASPNKKVRWHHDLHLILTKSLKTKVGTLKNYRSSSTSQSQTTEIMTPEDINVRPPWDQATNGEVIGDGGSDGEDFVTIKADGATLDALSSISSMKNASTSAASSSGGNSRSVLRRSPNAPDDQISVERPTDADPQTETILPRRPRVVGTAWAEGLAGSHQPPVGSPVTDDDETRNCILFFIHGVGGCARLWQNQLAYFSGKGYEVLSFDLIGHGRSNRPRNSRAYCFDEIKIDVLAIFDKHAKLKNVVVAHSYGTCFATVLARERESKISHLVLLSSGGPVALEPEFMTPFVIPSCCLQLGRPYLDTQFVKRSFAVQPSPSDFKLAFGATTSTVKRIVAGQHWLDGDWSFHRLISTPTLLVHGGQDGLVSLREMHDMRTAITNSQLVVLDSAGHMAMLEAAEQLNLLIEDFLQTTFERKQSRYPVVVNAGAEPEHVRPSSTSRRGRRLSTNSAKSRTRNFSIV